MSLLKISEKTSTNIKNFISGEKRTFTTLASLFGPALIASIAYVDPGNYATNIEAGSKFGYSLLWVVVLANLVAMLFQAMSARLGIVTGYNLAELCRQYFPRPLVIFMWIFSEIGAIATDLAEFIGGAIGFSLLFHFPLMIGMVITAILTYALLFFEKFGFRAMEILVTIFVGIIFICYLLELFIAPVDWASVGLHCFKPEMPNMDALLISVGIIGATVMPHAIYLHSGLTTDRVKNPSIHEKRKLVKYSNIEVIVGLFLAGAVNLSMVIMAASSFHSSNHIVTEVPQAYYTLQPILGAAAATLYLTSLLASGVSSSIVGTMAGQVIMQGFVGFHIPIWLRRAITIVPSFIVVALGFNETNCLVYSQVILSLVLPLPMISLCYFVNSTKVMGEFRNKSFWSIIAILATILILALNFFLIYQTISG